MPLGAVWARPEPIGGLPDGRRGAWVGATPGGGGPPLRVMLPVPVQPLRSKVLLLAPPLRLATWTWENWTVPPAELVTPLSARVKSTSPLPTKVLLPAPPWKLIPVLLPGVG